VDTDHVDTGTLMPSRPNLTRMGRLSTWRESQRLRRGAIGALSGAVAGVTAASLEGGFVVRYGTAAFVGIVAFVALKLLLD
jgi:hypothetical protein